MGSKAEQHLLCGRFTRLLAVLFQYFHQILTTLKQFFHW